MPRRALTAILLAAFATPALAAPAAPTVVAPFVWRVDPPKGMKVRRTPDYLLGTMHVPVGGARKLSPRVEALVRGASRFLMEVDLTRVDAGEVRRFAAIAPGQDLKAMLPPAAWPKLVKLSAPLGLGDQELRGLDPWFVALSFLPTPPDAGELMDSRLRRVAEAARVPLAFLETPADQFRALDAVAEKEDVAQLVEILEEPDRPAAELAKLEHAYLAGDLAGVEAYLFEPDRLKSYPDFYDKVFYGRTRRWLPAVERALHRDDAFVAVGLGHVVGDKGLLALLRQRGWRVRRVV